MERKQFSTLFFIKRTKLLKNGEAPIILRITYDGQSSEVNISRSVPVKKWSQSRTCSLGRDAVANELNTYIEMVRMKIQQIHYELIRQDKLYSAKAIKDIYQGSVPDRKTLYTIFKEHNDKCRQLIGVDYVQITICRYDNCLKYLMQTVKQQYGKDDIYLTEINSELVRNFEFFLKTERKCAQNTVIRYMKCFKKIINLAIGNEWMTRNPFVGIKFYEEKVIKEFLTQDEINLMMRKTFKIERLELVRDVFVFCCYTGLAFIDVYNLRGEHIFLDNKGKAWIRKTREKTNNMCDIPLLTAPQQILEKYKDHPICKANGVLLPVISNQKMNSYLKEIADFCGITKNLTTHTARHTFASVIALGNNVALTNVAKMLGHSSTRMTQHYAKVLDSSIMRDMENVEVALAANSNY